MKNAFITTAIVLALGAIPFCAFHFTSNVQTIYALCIRDMEYSFVVLDESTTAPIRGAKLTLMIEDWRKNEPMKMVQLVADADGKVAMFRKDPWCDDVIRPLRKTVTQIDRTWCCSLSIEAEGYKKIADTSLYDWIHTDHGYVADEKLQRIEYVFPLEKP